MIQFITILDLFDISFDLIIHQNQTAHDLFIIQDAIKQSKSSCCYVDFRYKQL